MRLAVAMQARFVAAQEHDLDRGRVAHDRRTIGERVRGHRHEQDRRHLGIDDRPERRERVRGRTRGRGDDQAIGAHGVDEASVDRDRAIDHAAHRAAIDDDIVQRFGVLARSGLARQRGGEQRARFLDVCTIEHRAEHGFHLGDGNVGEESEPTLVDADQWHAEGRELACDREHGAIAADDDCELRDAPEFAGRRGRVALQWRVSGGSGVQHHAMAARDEELREPAQRFGDPRGGMAPNQGDGGEGPMGRAHRSTFVLRTPVFTLGTALRAHWSTFVLRTPVFALGTALRAHGRD